MKNGRFLPRLIAFAVLILALAALAVFVFIPIYSNVDAAPESNVVMYSSSAAEKEYALENEYLRFALNAESTQFTVTDKQCGRVWYSNPPEADKDALALAAEKERMNATLVLTYGTEAGVTALFNNYTYSIVNGVFDIEKTDTCVRVRYTLGKISKTYMMPTAITEERMAVFLANMDKSAKRTVDSQYRLYDINNLKKNDDKDALLAAYPDLAEMNLYILREGTQEHQKKKMEKSFVAAGYTAEDYAIDQEHLPGASIDDKPVFNVTLAYRLEGRDLVVEVPFDEIHYNAAYLPSKISVLPLFGAADEDDTGYMLLPDGGGAILNYNNQKLSQNSYYANVYGWDYGDARTEVVSETRASFPAFGMTGGDSAFLCMLEEGASYAAIQGDISGHANMYNTANAVHTLLHSEAYEVSAKTTSSVYMFEKELPEGGKIQQRYRFIKTNDYVDMALSYREYLLSRYPELTRASGSDAPLMIEFVGAIDKTVQRLGVPTSVPMEATTFDEAGRMLAELMDGGIRNVSARYTGWMNGGVNQSVLTRVKVLTQLGGEKKLTRFLEGAKALGVHTYVDALTQFAYDSGVFEGFITYRDAARFVTQEKAELYPYSPVWYGQMEFEDAYYLVKPAYALSCARTVSKAAAEFGADGVAFRDIGSLLSGDYNKNDRVSREENLISQTALIKDMRSAGQRIAIKAGNLYALPYADIVTDMTLRGEDYSILDALIPFYQIAVHGYIAYTGGSVNLSRDVNQAILEAAEYGAGLSFTFMNMESAVLRDTFYTYLYGAEYAVWKDEAVSIMRAYQKDMAGLNDQLIADHERLSDTLTLTVYENGARVYVNYGYADAFADGQTVPARSYIVTGDR